MKLTAKIELEDDHGYQVEFSIDDSDILYKRNILYLNGKNPQHTQLDFHYLFDCPEHYRNEVEEKINDFIFGEVDYKQD